jgi:hypothetical protein
MHIKIGQFEVNVMKQGFSIYFPVGDCEINVHYNVDDTGYSEGVKVDVDGMPFVTIPLPENQKEIENAT